ncbi:hypothetical protein ACI78Z_22030, partial [Geodermatophilus sp. SYSU D01176]
MLGSAAGRGLGGIDVLSGLRRPPEGRTTVLWMPGERGSGRRGRDRCLQPTRTAPGPLPPGRHGARPSCRREPVPVLAGDDGGSGPTSAALSLVTVGGQSLATGQRLSSAASWEAPPISEMERFMRVSVVGCGYLGAVHAASMAELGHEVVGIDVDERKVAALNEA